MSANNPPETQGLSEQSTLSIVQAIKSGQVNPKTIPKNIRQDCVEMLLLEGWTESSIAQVFDKSNKTIKRDIQAIYDKNAVDPDSNFIKRYVSSLIQRHEIHRGHLMRLARNKEGSVSERAQSEYAAWKVTKETTELLQKLGFLPERPQELISSVYHHSGGDVVTANDLEKKTQEIKDIMQDCSENTSVKQAMINEIESDIQKLKISEKLNQIALTQKENSNEDNH